MTCKGLIALLASIAVGASTMSAGPAHAADPVACDTVRLADIGWSDGTIQNAVFTAVAQGLGYRVKSSLLSTPVMYQAMKNGRIDVFLDDWTPTEDTLTAPYFGSRSIDRLGPDLTGAKYTLVVPDFLYKQGLRDVADISRFAGQVDHKIYGLEAGNSGNEHILAMIADRKYRLNGFHLVASSEAGMLAEAARRIGNKQGIIFLGWAPHPMNVEFKIDYLAGADAFFGPNKGESTVFIATRHGYAAQCPNMGLLLSKFRLDVGAENAMMYDVQALHKEPPSVAVAWLKAHPDWLASILSGVTTAKGTPGVANVETALKGD
jgi:glycine betaine/proline transport system substrate-binding protein